MADLVISNLTLEYKSKKRKSDPIVALDDLNVTFKEGTFNVILGYSGCGKTSLLRCIVGSLKHEGKIKLGEEMFSFLPISERKISYVSQNYVLYPRMTIFDNVAFPLKNAHLSREDIITKVEEITTLFDIAYTLTRKPKHLSGGQQQRVALCRALVKDSNIFLFDEPLSNVDAIERQEQRRIIKQIVMKKGATAVYVTHDIREALALADTLYVMDKGKIVVSGAPEEILKSENEIVVSLRKEME